LTRVTAVLDYFMEPGLVAWKVKVGAREARRIGTLAKKVGSRVDMLIKTGSKLDKKDSSEVRSCVEGYEKWYSDYRQPHIEVCQRLYDEKRGITGEPDIFIPETNTLLDIKCAGMINQKYWLQLAAYASMMSTKPATIGILRLHKSIGEYEYKVREFDERLVDVFNGMLLAYNYLCPNGENEQGGANGSSNGEATNSSADHQV
jgi:hypothetical protein